MSALEASLILETMSVRLGVVEGTLRHQASLQSAAQSTGRFSRIPGARRVGRIRGRVVSWTKPRIGRLRHYEPRPLVVPARYLRTAPPDPAPTVAIATPSFQQRGFIDRTIHSVLGQNYPALQYAVHDGGSTDGTAAYLASLNGKLTHWVSEPDDGQADAINRAFAHTSGEIMAWLNSDDLLLPGSLAYVARYFAEHPDVDVIYGHRVMIDENDQQIGAWIVPAHHDGMLTLADYVPQETLFWRRRIWDAAGGHVDPSFGYALDWDLLLRFRAAGAKIVRVPRYLGAFRIHDAQKTTAADKIGMVEMSRLRQRVHGRHVSTEEVLRRLRGYFLRHIVLHTRHRIRDRLPARRVLVELLAPAASTVDLAGEVEVAGDLVERLAAEVSTAGSPSKEPPLAGA